MARGTQIARRASQASPPAIASEYQSPALALESETPPKAAWWTLYTVVAFILAAIVWSSLAQIDEIVSASGELASTTLVVQPFELATIKSIDVKVGDVVKKGQELAVLDPTFAAADVDQSNAKLDGLMARRARLEAELAGVDYQMSAKPTQAELLENSLFQRRKSDFADHVRGYQQDVARIEATLASTRDYIESSKSQIAVLQQIVDVRQSLNDKALDTRLTLLDAQSQLLDAQRSMGQSQGSIDELTHEMQSTQAQLDAYAGDWREQAADDLTTVQQNIESAEADLDKALRRRAMTSLVSPRDAIVLDIAVRSAGSVLQGGESLFTLVPLDVPIDAEVHVSPQDVGFIKVGDDVRLKLDAFPFQKYGALSGVIETISADSFTPATDPQARGAASTNGASYYKARVHLTSNKLPHTPPNYRLLPGMTTTADIDVGTRTVMSYLLYPILRGLDESIREP